MIDTEIVTNSSGQAAIELQDGRYKIVEVEAPEGYTLNTEPVIHDFVAGGENEITFRNNPQTDLIDLDKKYPVYDFKHNKGYPTKKHVEAIEKYGIIAEHRRSYAPLYEYIERNKK